MRRQTVELPLTHAPGTCTWRCRPAIQASLALCAMLFCTPVISQGFPGGGDATANFTLTHGLTFRAAKPNNSWLADPNGNDGNSNYNRGLVSNTSSLTGEFEVNGDNLGLFARIHGFVDFENLNGMRERTPLSDDALDVAGRDFRLLDFYVSGAFDPGGIPLDLRLGNQVLNWGESTFVPNGINVINPIDVSRLRTPGSELRDALVPVPMAYAAIEPVPNFSVEGFYQFEWKKTQIDPVGTYFSTTDYVGPGGQYAFLSLPGLTPSDRGAPFSNDLNLSISSDIYKRNRSETKSYLKLDCDVTHMPGTPIRTNAEGSDCQPAYDPYFLAVKRDKDVEPSNGGEFGVALRYLSPALNDTEFGFFFVNAHSRLPIVSGKVGNALAIAQSVNIKDAVESLGSDTRQLITGAVAEGQGPTLAKLLGLNLSVFNSFDSDNKVTALTNAISQGLAYDHFAKASQYFVEYPEDLETFGVSFNTVLGTSGWALQGEYSFHPNLPLQSEETWLFSQALRPLFVCLIEPGLGCLETSPTNIKTLPIPNIELLGTDLPGYVRRDVSQAQVTATQVFGSVLGSDSTGFITEAAMMKVHSMPDPQMRPLETLGTGDGADATSWGYRGAIWLDYNNAIGAVNLSPYVQFQHDVSGSSPAPFGPFVEGRKVMTLGVGADYLERWSADLSYTTHAGAHNPLADRDFVSLSFSYSF